MVKEVAGLKKAAGEGGGVRSMGVSATTSAAAWRRDAELLRSRIASTESEVGLRMNAIEIAVGSKLDEITRRLDATAATSGSSATGLGLEDEVKLMREKMKILEARVSSKPVIIGEKIFSSFPDVHKFVVDSVPPNVYFLFHDPVTLLESISDAYTSKADVMTEMH